MAAEKRPREDTMVSDLDVTRQALYTENQEVQLVRSCLSVMETALAAAHRETAMAEAAMG